MVSQVAEVCHVSDVCLRLRQFRCLSSTPALRSESFQYGIIISGLKKKTRICNSRQNICLCGCQLGTLISFGSPISGMYREAKTVTKQKKVAQIIPYTPSRVTLPVAWRQGFDFEPTLTDTAGYGRDSPSPVSNMSPAQPVALTHRERSARLQCGTR